MQPRCKAPPRGGPRQRRVISEPLYLYCYLIDIPQYVVDIPQYVVVHKCNTCASMRLLKRHPPFQDRVEDLDADPAFFGRLFLREIAVQIGGDLVFKSGWSGMISSRG
jgi:hypothetical protein